MSNDFVQEKITIADVASALGISKTTVSRAISGKGRIGEQTRKRVMDYIEENNYRPSPIARGLTESKTYNICWAMPGDSGMTSLPFFLRSMAGTASIDRTGQSPLHSTHTGTARSYKCQSPTSRAGHC